MNKAKFILLTLAIAAFLPLLYACNAEERAADESDIQTVPDVLTESTTETDRAPTAFGIILNEGDPLHDHSVSEDVVSPTCMAEGYTLYVCECGFKAKDKITALVDHTLMQKAVAPTCTEYGGTLEYCTACTYSEMIEYSSVPIGHSTSITVLQATCEEPERTVEECSVCDYSKTEITSDALGHDHVAPDGVDRFPSAIHPEISYTSTCHCGDAIQTEISYADVFGGAYVSSTEVVARGIDVSMWQFAQNSSGDYIELDWQAIKDAGIDFVILKIGSGNHAPTFFKDPTFEASYAGAKAAGLDVGCYFYSYATSIEGISAEADFLLTLLEGKQFEYPVYLDFEDPSQETIAKDVKTDMAITFLSKIQSKGYYGALYAGQYWLHNYYDTARINSLFDVWMAKYRSSTQEQNEDEWDETYTFTEAGAYGMWQFTSTATVLGNGVSIASVGIASPSVDKNYCYKDYPTLIKSLGYNGFLESDAE